ncbi:HmuY family protein [Aquimarina sp. 2201CG1-2-11]|uniref:IPT/TIG domain-containing protein n=1 Tax=Aquimarina discodermiae TaxID=3231043 RepID=UPI00346183D0
MKKVKFIFLMLSILLASCSSDDDAVMTETAEFAVQELSAEQGVLGSEITINGTGFPSSTAELSVTFNGTTATIKSVTSTAIVVTIPEDATSGDIIVKYGTKTLNAGTFAVLKPLVENKVENLSAPQTGGQGQPVGGDFTKFDFETGEITTSDTDWDIAFRGTTIAVNGGATTGTADEPARNGEVSVAIAEGIFSNITTADGLSFSQDTDQGFAIPTGSDNGWYNYSGAPNHLITPIPGKILVFKTSNGNYAKVEILSYYKDAPANPNVMTNEGRYYTFKYVYNPNVGVTSFE